MVSLATSPVLGILVSLHVLAAVIWVGGLFFSYVVLRPAAAELDSSVRLDLWGGVLHRYFRWIWLAVVTLIATGQLQIAATFGTYRFAPLYVHLMQGLGILMTLLFLYAWFAPWRQLKRAVGEQRRDSAVQHLARVRHIVLANLLLGLTTIVVATGGRFF